MRHSDQPPREPMTTPTIPIAAVSSAAPQPAAHTARMAAARLTAAFRAARSPATSADAVWVPAASAALIIVVGAAGLAMQQPLLFAALGPTALVMASSPGHHTARFHNVVLGHLAALACAWLAVVLVGVGGAPSGRSAMRAAQALPQAVPLARVWASGIAVALTAAVQPSLRAYHPPAVATALLVTTGVYRATFKTSLELMAGVLLLALLGEWLQRMRLNGQPGAAAS